MQLDVQSRPAIACTITLLLDVHVVTGCTKYTELAVQNTRKKSFSKPINMGSTFEDLDARISNMQTVHNLDKRFKRYSIFKKRILKNKCGPNLAQGDERETQQNYLMLPLGMHATHPRDRV